MGPALLFLDLSFPFPRVGVSLVVRCMAWGRKKKKKKRAAAARKPPYSGFPAAARGAAALSRADRNPRRPKTGRRKKSSAKRKSETDDEPPACPSERRKPRLGPRAGGRQTPVKIARRTPQRDRPDCSIGALVLGPVGLGYRRGPAVLRPVFWVGGASAGDPVRWKFPKTVRPTIPDRRVRRQRCLAQRRRDKWPAPMCSLKDLPPYLAGRRFIAIEDRRFYFALTASGPIRQ